MRRPSKRFTPNPVLRWLVPALMIVLLLVLLGTIIVIGLSLAGLTPGI